MKSQIKSKSKTHEVRTWLYPEQIKKLDKLVLILEKRKSVLYREAMELLFEKYSKELKKKG